MARGYRTSQPQFVQDIMYQPPWQLMQQAMAAQQAGYDSALTQTDALNGMLNILHRNSEADTAAANEIKDYYTNQIDSLTSSIQQDPSNWRKSLSSIRNLQREMQQDRQSGNIARLEGTYNAYNTRLKEIQDLKEKHPDKYNAAVINAELAYADRNWGGDSINKGIWKTEGIINQPDLFNAKDTIDLIKKIPEFSTANSIIRKNNGYLITTDTGDKFVSSDRIEQLLQGVAFSDPNMMSYLDQQQRFGLGNYYKDGKLISPVRRGFVDSVGNEVTPEEYMAMTSAEKEKVSPTSIYANNPLGKIFSLANPMSYSQYTELRKAQEDSVYMKELDRQHDANMKRLQNQLDIARDNNNYANKVNYGLLSGELTPEQVQGDLIAQANLSVWTPEELKIQGDKMSKYIMMESQGKQFTPEQQEEFNSLNTLYSQVASEFNMTPREVMLIHALQNDPNFGLERGEDISTGVSSMGIPTTGRTIITTPERKEALAAQAKFNKANKGIKDWNTNLQNKITQTYTFYSPSKNTERGRMTYELMDAALNGTNVMYYDGNSVLTDKNGNIKPGKNRLDTKIGDGWSNSEAGANPLKYLVSTLGGKPTDYIQNPKPTWDGSKMVIRGTLRIPKEREDNSYFNGFDNEDLEDFVGKEVAIITDRIENPEYANYLNNDPFFSGENGKDWLRGMDRKYKSIENKVNYSLSQIPDFNTSSRIMPGLVVTNNGNGTYRLNNYDINLTQYQLKALLYNTEGLSEQDRKNIIDKRLGLKK